MKTKKAILAAVAATISGIVALSFAGCQWFDFSSRRNTASVSGQLGYENGMGAWLASEVDSPRSSAWDMYQEAKAHNAIDDSVSFMDFLKMLNDDSASLTTSLRASVAIDAGKGYGSGVIYSLQEEKDGLNAYVITNYHVAYDGSGISRKFATYLYGDTFGDSKSARSTTYVGGSSIEDIAVLSVKIPNDRADFVQSITDHAGKRNSDDVNVGERVYAIGNPYGAGISAVSGVVAVEAEYTWLQGITSDDAVKTLTMRIDAPVNPGNSGGGLFDVRGTFLGLVSGSNEQEVGEGSVPIGGFGYALPANRVVSVAQSIIDNLENETQVAFKGLLGELAIVSSRGEFNSSTNTIDIVETVKITNVNSKSPFGADIDNKVLQRIEVQDDQGDTIVKADILRMHQVETILYNLRKGFTVTLHFEGGGKATATYDTDGHFEQVY